MCIFVLFIVNLESLNSENLIDCLVESTNSNDEPLGKFYPSADGSTDRRSSEGSTINFNQNEVFQQFQSYDTKTNKQKASWKWMAVPERISPDEDIVVHFK